MTQPCRSPYCECDTNKCTHPGFHDARDLMEEPKMNNPSTLPTTQLTAYVATDGSLWLNEEECLEKNRLIVWDKLNDHVSENCETEPYECSHSDHITAYIVHNFDKIKTLLGK